MLLGCGVQAAEVGGCGRARAARAVAGMGHAAASGQGQCPTPSALL